MEIANAGRMFATLLIVLPVFALILAGWLVRRLGVMGPQAAGELNRFVVYLALPALLFEIVAGSRPAEIWQPGFIASFGLGCLLVFGVTLALRWRGPRQLADAAIDALAGSYANTGYIGFPLALAVFGPAGLTPTLIASIVTVCAIFAVAIVLIESGLQAERHPGRLALKVAVSLAKNPLLVAPLLAAVFPLSGTALPDAAGRFLKLLGGAASPCALVSLGLFLAEKRPASAAAVSGATAVGETRASGSETRAAALLIALKLALQPLATWLLATRVFHLPPALVQPAVLLAGLPTGTGPFMLAEFYRREAGVTSKAIVGSTVLSVLTITAYLSFAR